MKKYIKKFIYPIIWTVMCILIYILITMPYYLKNNNVSVENKQFEVISEESLNNTDQLITVRHKDTGREFLIYKGSNRSGITHLTK